MFTVKSWIFSLFPIFSSQEIRNNLNISTNTRRKKTTSNPAPDSSEFTEMRIDEKSEIKV